jgi:hypothetical protein
MIDIGLCRASVSSGDNSASFLASLLQTGELTFPLIA